MATRKTTGDLATRRGAGDPETSVTPRPPPSGRSWSNARACEGDRHFPVVTAELCRLWILSCPRGLWVSMRHPAQLDMQLVSANDTLSVVRFLIGCFAWRRSWKCPRPISSERRVQKADTRLREIDAISLASLPSLAVGVAASPSFFGSPAHWRPLTSQMLACSQLKCFRRPYAALMPIAVFRFSA